MSRNLGFTTLESGISSNDIFASNAQALQKTNIVIASGQNLTRGTMLGKNSSDGKYYKYNSGASDGTETLAGILGVDTDATSADGKAFMFITGEYKKTELTAQASSMVTVGTFFNANVNLQIIGEE